MDQTLTAAAADLLEKCRSNGLRLATAESCTGGLIAACLTEIPGSSDVVERGFVTYSNVAKSEMLDVPVALIATEGAVSEAVAIAMAEGALSRSPADLAVAVTGIAGPGGGSDAKPVGLVHIAASRTGRKTMHRGCEFGDLGRDKIRQRTVLEAFALVAAMI